MKRRHFLKATLALSIAGCSGPQEQADQDIPDPDGPSDARGSEEQGTILKFGVIADPQYADQPDRGTRFYRNSLAKLSASVSDLNEYELDFVVTLGDVIDKDFASFSEIMPLYDQLWARHIAIPGNHDFDVDDADKHRVLPAMNITDSWHSESLSGWRLLFLDGTDLSCYRYPADDDRTAAAEEELERLRELELPNAKAWNSAIGEAQFSWLEEQLKESLDNKERVIVFCHFPVMPAGDAHNLWNANEVVELLSRFDHVAAYMNGHNHGGNYARHNGCHFVNFKGMVETEVETAYAVVSCFSDRIEIEGFGLEPDQNLS
ncbi:MAG: metallophosphoesterase [Planctomycetota bacterium]